MIRELHIRNYALIDELSIDFSKGLNIITGETGAGKSIIIGALSLILGDRADSSALLNTSQKCVVEGLFSADKEGVIDFLKEEDLYTDSDVIIRREVSANGKSRAFINDTPANLDQLKRLAMMLVDLHRQFDTVDLATANLQREIIDAVAGSSKMVNQYGEFFRQWRAKSQHLAALMTRKATVANEADYHKFLLEELVQANFANDEIEDAERELKTLSHAEEIKAGISFAANELIESDNPITNQLKILSQQIDSLSKYCEPLAGITERIRSTQIELQDIGEELQSLISTISTNPEKIEMINERISLGFRLFKKHGVRTTSELLEVKRNLETTVHSVDSLDEEVKRLESEVSEIHQTASNLAVSISETRRGYVPIIEKKVNALLEKVGMPNARFRVSITSTSDLNHFGKDVIEFLFDPNKSDRFEPLRVASGGELSRLLLCVKSLVAEKINLPTLIFDEIDSGISGEAARQVALIMKNLSASRQVISITHQPQIAGRADVHYYVYKEDDGGLRTRIKKLSDDERVVALARMLGGQSPSRAAMDNAREMIAS